MYTKRLILGCWLLGALGLVAQATTLDKVKERRKARIPEVRKLLKSGKASEGADGFLVAKESLPEKKAELLKDENSDRKVGYEAIAKANNKKSEEIGKKAGEINRKRAAKLKEDN